MTHEKSPAETSAPNEIVISRVFAAPRELVWTAWTDPKQVAQWWGPRGFSTTIRKMDVRPGGVWEQTLHGPDGASYPNKSVFKEVVRPERIVYAHDGCREHGPGASFTATWTFEAIETDKTRLTIRMVFATAQERDFVVKEFGALDGGRQTLERLGAQIARMQCEPFIISREFNAPRELVWSAWTERRHFERWFGPKGFKIHVAKFDLHPDGMTHYRLTTPDGAELWGRAVYREIVPPTRIVWINSFSDQDGGITRHPFRNDPWPLQMLTEITFAEHAAKTTVTVNWLPIDATQAEIDTFNTGRASMNGGWSGTFEQLTDYLATAQKPG